MAKKSGFNLLIMKSFLLAIIIVLVGGGFFVVWASTLPIPDVNTYFNNIEISESTKIFDRTGKVLLYDVHGNVKRTVVPFEAIAPSVKNATIAIEDADFYNHNGIKPTAILRAFRVNLLSGRLKQGGSTITQQVIKNVLLINDKKISRKIKEFILAPKLESSLTKDEILNLYLNAIPYGGNIYGVEEASQNFFKKSAADLTLAESAYLAALPQAPSYFSPYGNNREALNNRKNLVLKRMLDLKMISKEEHDAARAEQVVFAAPENRGIKAPHFVFYIKSYLEEKYGKEAIESGGLKVITTLDWELQQKAEEITKRFGEENTRKFNAKNASLVAVDPKTGEILVMVGSKDYFDVENDGNYNVALAERQPGSTFKPFAYATAINKGYTSETAVFDVPTEFDTGCSPDSVPLTPEAKCYHPVNYDDLFLGPMTFRTALAQSRNIPAIKVLYLAGIADAVKTAQAMGISTLKDPRRYGLTLVLGGGEVTLLEMTSAYGVFANDGVRAPHEKVLRVEDRKGKVLEEFKPQTEEVLPANTARVISSILSDNVARTPGYGANSPLYFGGRDVAAKTGTTNDFKDTWIIGYSPNIAVGAWAGNNDNTPIDKKVAGLVVAPMWRAFMDVAMAERPDEKFVPPDPIDPNIKPYLRGNWQEGGVHSILHWVEKSNPLGPVPSNPGSDPQYRLWETSVARWAASQGHLYNSPDQAPNSTPGSANIEIESPLSGTTYKANETIEVKFSYDGEEDLKQAEIFLNNQLLGTVKKRPLRLSFVPREQGGARQVNDLKIVAYDEKGGRTEKSLTLNLSDL